MRIHDEDSDKTLSNVTLFLTMDEARQLRDFTGGLIDDPKRNHAHVNSAEYDKELTVAIYDPDDLETYGFDERALRVLRDDE